MKIYNQNNNLVNTNKMEKPEQDLAKKYIKKDDVSTRIRRSLWFGFLYN